MVQECILITGSAGFIGFSLSKQLLAQGHRVIGVDNFNDYYDVRLKKARMDQLIGHENFKNFEADICSFDSLKKVFEQENPTKVCHLAAQAGVRYSLINPFAYIKSNINGFLNMIELAKDHKLKNFVYASSSSVYGGNKELPFGEDQRVDSPISLYAATKKSDELIAHTYSHLYKLPTTGLRFFTVYGPWGRPDMALFLFAKAMMEDKPIDVYNHGKMHRSFTYIQDIVDGVVGVLEKNFDYEVLNIGNDQSSSLMEYIEVLEKKMGKTAQKNFLDIQPGDVPATCADLTRIRQKTGFEPKTKIEEGIGYFVEWFKEFYPRIKE